jgi:hypothetical protein
MLKWSLSARQEWAQDKSGRRSEDFIPARQAIAVDASQESEISVEAVGAGISLESGALAPERVGRDQIQESKGNAKALGENLTISNIILFMHARIFVSNPV